MRFKHYLGFEFLFKQQLISLYVNDSGRGGELPEKCGNSDRKLKTEWRMGSFRSPCVVCSGNSSFVLAGAPSVLRPELPRTRWGCRFDAILGFLGSQGLLQTAPLHLWHFWDFTALGSNSSLMSNWAAVSYRKEPKQWCIQADGTGLTH